MSSRATIYAAVLLATFGLWLAVGAGCGTDPAPEDDANLGVRISSVAPKTVLPGTTLHVRGDGFREDDSVRLRFEGSLDGRSVSVTRRASSVDSKSVSTEVDSDFFDTVGTDSGTFSGTLVVSIRRGKTSVQKKRDLELSFATSLDPKISAVSPKTATFQDKIIVEGSGFLLSGEGQTVFKANGEFRPDDGDSETVEDLILPLEPDRRNESLYVHSPEAFGLRTGTFEGSIKVENYHDGPGDITSGNSLEISLDFQKPQLDAVTPKELSRGQKLQVLGAGFVPKTSGNGQHSSLLLTGTFTNTEGETTSYEGGSALSLAPEFAEAGVLEYVLRPQVTDDEELVGLGSEPGVFRGKMQARIHYGGEEMRTEAREVKLTILPTKQIVYIKYLPGFSGSLRKFGMRNVEGEIRDRILEVCERDYKPYNVECREEPPENYEDYITLHVGGRDPNGGGFFGLDNSKGVDRGNLRLNEVVGGRRATDEDADRFMYGGVFVESFLAFSPNLSQSIPIESKKFDEVFGPFISELGGNAVEVDEYPSGPRVQKIDRAIRALGSLIGNTVVHEAAHAMGMANTGIPGEVHHSGVQKNLIMNSGADRSFERRAELDGVEPSVWGKRDSEYMERILPKP